jgi:hypothetical protein
MHGGRQQLYCRYKTYKRFTGNPFARHENLECENLKKHLCNVHNEQDIESHEPARRDGRRPTEVVSKLDSDMQSPSSSSNRLGSKDGRHRSSGKINRTLVADLKAETSTIQAMYNTQGAVITDLKGQLSMLQAQLEDRVRDSGVDL